MRDPRRILLFGGIGLLVLYLLWTAKHLGADVDQTFDQQYLLNNLHGFVEFDRWPVGNPTAADAKVEGSYGNTFQMIAFMVSWLLSSIWNEPFDPFSASTFTDKNVMIALISLVAFWGVYHATRSLTGRRRTAVVASVLLALLPVFTGHVKRLPSGKAGW